MIDWAARHTAKKTANFQHIFLNSKPKSIIIAAP